jgi:diguanylate cyclase (GGDEF)-like protein
VCLPLTAGGHLVGVLGISEGAFAEGRRRTVAMSAALLAIGIRNALLFSEVRDNSLRDGLTACINRTHGLEVIETELRRSRRSQMPVSLIMFDIDHFKDINDRHGHLCGDAVLAAVGARLRDLLRASDLKCRYGGEEFLVLLPETALEGAKRVADTLRRELADTSISWKDARIAITASFGVTTALPAEVDAQALIGRADRALYRAKDQGRNCVRLSIESSAA